MDSYIWTARPVALYKVCNIRFAAEDIAKQHIQMHLNFYIYATYLMFIPRLYLWFLATFSILILIAHCKYYRILPTRGNYYTKFTNSPLSNQWRVLCIIKNRAPRRAEVLHPKSHSSSLHASEGGDFRHTIYTRKAWKVNILLFCSPVPFSSRNKPVTFEGHPY